MPRDPSVAAASHQHKVFLNHSSDMYLRIMIGIAEPLRDDYRQALNLVALASVNADHGLFDASRIGDSK